MTRAMFAAVLYRIEDRQSAIDDKGYAQVFNDIVEGAWYYDAVLWAADKGIVSGVGGGKFDPNAPVTREQMAVMLWNYIQHKEYELKATAAGAAFADEEKISDWARDSVKSIQRAGIIGGKPGNLFDPQGVATRAEVATIFARFAEQDYY